MTQRLTVDIKNSILVAVLHHAFEKREKELIAQEHELAGLVYADVYKDTFAKMNALPDGYLPERSDISVAFGSKDSIAVLHMRGLYRCAKKWHGWCDGVPKIYEHKHPLTLHYQRYAKAKDALKQERKDAERKANAVINSVTTVKRLLQVWPEAEKFIKPHLGNSESRALTVPMIELNKALGLPPDASTKRK
jgi:hypothetical protein